MIFDDTLNEIKEIYSVLRLKEVKHRLTFEKSSQRMVQAMERFKSCDSKKPKALIKKEMSLCRQFWNCYPLHYYRYNLYRSDKELTERELTNYIPEFFFYSLFLSFHDSKEFSILLNDKSIMEQIFRSSSIAQPPTICKLIHNHFYNKELEQTSYTALEQELKKNTYKKIFIKPLDGQGGFGIYTFHKNSSGEYVSKSNKALNEELLHTIGKTNDYILQAGIEQDESLEALHPHSVNTFRIATENINGTVRVLCATLRIGRNGNQVDNGTQGGIILKINIDTGETGHFATSEECEHFDKHPDTKFSFKDFKIPKWDQVKSFSIGSAKKVPQFTYLGWDIALGKNGPLALETNLGFGLDHYQIPLGGLREVFRINDPLFYWNNRGKR